MKLTLIRAPCPAASPTSHGNIMRTLLSIGMERKLLLIVNLKVSGRSSLLFVRFISGINLLLSVVVHRSWEPEHHNRGDEANTTDSD